MKPQDLEPVIDRIRNMEACFDQLQQATATGIVIAEDPQLSASLQILMEYYESSLWRQDYELDEKGVLPSGLKRGVLSEDGIYNFLSEIQEVTG